MSDSAPLPTTRAATILDRFRGKGVLVVGDLVLDEYLIARATRLSREAPVPVLELMERNWRPGAAANPAANVAALGGRAVMVGVVGRDGAGQQLRSELERAGVDPGGLVEAVDRTTAVKTRILATHASAHPQQMARIDDLPRGPLSDDVEQMLATRIGALLPSCAAVLVSNYRGGAVTPRVLRVIVESAREHGIPTCVDTQGDLPTFQHFTLVKSNQPDAEAALGEPLRAPTDYQRVGARLLTELGAEQLVITRGADGMSVIERDGQHTHLPPTNRTEVWDVTGAGDTVIAVLALGLAAGVDPIEVAGLANTAAGLVVQRIGVATVTPAELLAALRPESSAVSCQLSGDRDTH